MMSFKRFGSKPVVKYAYIGISADRQRHNLFWLFKYRICPIRIEIIHGGLNIYGFYHGMALYADILPLAIARGKIFGIKCQPVVKSIYIQTLMNYFLIEPRNKNFNECLSLYTTYICTDCIRGSTNLHIHQKFFFFFTMYLNNHEN